MGTSHLTFKHTLLFTNTRSTLQGTLTEIPHRVPVLGFLTDIVFFIFLLEDGGHLNGFYGDDQRSWLRKGVKGTGVQAEGGVRRQARLKS